MKNILFSLMILAAPLISQGARPDSGYCKGSLGESRAVSVVRNIDILNERDTNVEYRIVSWERDGNSPAAIAIVEKNYPRTGPGGNPHFKIKLNGGCQVIYFEELPVLE